MSEKQYDYSKRDVDSRSKSFRIDVNNPQEGQSGPEAYKIIGETDDGVKVSQSLSQTGLFRITSEGTMEIVGGSKNKPKGLDRVGIVSKPFDCRFYKQTECQPLTWLGGTKNLNTNLYDKRFTFKYPDKYNEGETWKVIQ